MPGYIAASSDSRKWYKFTRPVPLDLNVYGTKGQDRDGSYTVNLASQVRAEEDYYDGDLALGGCTGAVWRVGSPTGYYSDRWDRKYQVQPTGCFVVSGQTGPDGGYRVSWSVSFPNVTGAAHGQYYGVEVWAGATGPHFSNETVLKVDDTIG
jgi:hypothetical protein